MSSCTGSDQQALETFAETYVQNHERGDVAALMDLVVLPENQPELPGFVRMAFAEEVQWPLKDLQIEPIPRSERKERKNQFPLEPRWRVYVILDTEDRFTSVWLAGKTEDGVALLVERDADAAEPPGR